MLLSTLMLALRSIRRNLLRSLSLDAFATALERVS